MEEPNTTPCSMAMVLGISLRARIKTSTQVVMKLIKNTARKIF
jgi:hypothetical protein